MAKDARKYTAAELTEMLRVRYPVPKYAFLAQVPDGTSGNKTRTADAIAMGCWHTVGIRLHGHEIKVNRGDWISELQQPEKSAPFIQHCHHWWIVASPGIVKLDEMPAEWGLMEPIASGVLKVRKAASLLEPDLLSFEFLASLMRKHVEQDVVEARVRKARKDGYNEGHAAGVQSASWQSKSLRNELEQLRKKVREFETTSGVQILHGWSMERTAEKFRAFCDMMQVEDISYRIESIRDIAAKSLEAANQLLEIATTKEEGIDARPESERGQRTDG